METGTDLIEWAAEHTQLLISPLGNRWLHIQGVVERARAIYNSLDENDRTYLIAAAYLHDIGYAPELRKTGFHPLDGAYYLLSHNQQRLASLVAYHSEAQFEANLRGLEKELEKIPREYSAIADALTYCDMTTGPTGLQIIFEERIDDILQRYDKTDIVARAIRQAIPTLALSVKRVQEALNHHRTKRNEREFTMIDHVVLLQPKANVTEEDITRVLSHVQGLQENIPGIVKTRVGKNLSVNHQGYVYGFTMRFLDEEHIKAYAPHPAHQVVSKELQNICQSIIDFDIE